MVLPGKHPERDSTNRQKTCVNTKPKAVPRKADKSNRSNDQKGNTCHQEPSKNMESLQPWINGVAEDHDMFQSFAKRNNWPENKNQFAEANDPRQKIQKAITFCGEERPLISFTNYDCHRPE